jgi:dTDP-4-dehydrorhamnose 3,5-epimerase
MAEGENMPFQFQRLEIPDLVLVTPRRFADDRGFFCETYKASAFAAFGIEAVFVQDNCSHSLRGVLRGLHFQKPPHAQAKLVRVIYGAVVDVAVDIRAGSPTYRRWTSVHLSAENGQMLYIPPGFAHGFCVLSAEAGLSYKVTHEYAPRAEVGIRWDDPDIGVEWPLADPIVSARDAALPLLSELGDVFVY